MLMCRNGNTEKCWKQYERFIKPLAVRWFCLGRRRRNHRARCFLLQVTLNGVIRGQSVWRSCASAVAMNEILPSPRSPIGIDWANTDVCVFHMHTVHMMFVLLCVCVYSLTSPQKQSTHMDLLWHVYSRTDMTFVGTTKAHHMRLKHNLPSGSKCFNKITLQNMLMTYSTLLYAALVLML